MDDKELLDEIQTEFSYLKEIRAERETEWRETANFVSASLDNWTDSSSSKPQRPERYTSAPAHFLSTLVSGLLGYTLSPNITWMKLTLDDQQLLNLSGVKDFLEQCERRMYAEYARSNLYSEATLFVYNAARYGHGVMLIDEDLINKRIRFTTMATPEIFLDTNEHGEVDTVYRYYSMTLRQAVSFFGEENMSVQAMTRYNEPGGKNTRINLLHAVYPRRDRNTDSLDIRDAPWASVYVDMDNQWLIEEKGYRQLPYAVFVWERTQNTGYGDCPAQNAMPDILLLNLMEESRARITQLAGDPAYNVPEQMKGQESVVPGGFNYYKKQDEVIQVINPGANFPITFETIRTVEQRIKDWFHVDFFLMLQARDQQKTATEVVELQGEKAAVLSSLIVNQNMALSAITRRTYTLMGMGGKLPQPPEILAMSQASLEVDFVGPLAMAQKRYHQTGGISQSLAMAGPVLQMNPTAIDYLDTDKLLISILDNNQFPQDVIREQDAVDQIRAARIKQHQEAQQAAAMQQQSAALMQNLGNLNQQVKSGSVLEELSKQQAGSLAR